LLILIRKLSLNFIRYIDNQVLEFMHLIKPILGTNICTNFTICNSNERSNFVEQVSDIIRDIFYGKQSNVHQLCDIIRGIKIPFEFANNFQPLYYFLLSPSPNIFYFPIISNIKNILYLFISNPLYFFKFFYMVLFPIIYYKFKVKLNDWKKSIQ